MGGGGGQRGCCSEGWAGADDEADAYTLTAMGAAPRHQDLQQQHFITSPLPPTTLTHTPLPVTLPKMVYCRL